MKLYNFQKSNLRKWIKNLVFSILILSSVYHCCAQVVTEDRIAYYPFNGNINNEDGNYHGSNFGATLTDDRFGNPNNAYYFNGNSDYIEIPHNEEMNFGGSEEFAISLWVNISKDQNDLDGLVNDIIGKWNDNNSSGYPYAIRYRNFQNPENQRNRIQSNRYNSETCNGSSRVYGVCISTDTWHHIVFQKQGSTLFYFQDGELVTTLVDEASSVCTTKNNYPIQIGKRSGGNIRYFTGKIDDISIYNRPLTESEITSIIEYNDWVPPDSNDESTAEILSFDLVDIEENYNITNKSNHTINIEVPCNVSLDDVITSFTLSDCAQLNYLGAIQTSGVSSFNLDSPIEFEVKNPFACSSVIWTVDVVIADGNEEPTAQISSFDLDNVTENYINIDRINKTIDIEVPCNTAIENVVASFTLSDQAYLQYLGITQVSGSGSFNFSAPIIVEVLNDLTCTTTSWTVTVKKEPVNTEDSPQIESFDFVSVEEQSISINPLSRSIEVVLPCAVKINDLFANYSLAENTLLRNPETSLVNFDLTTEFEIYTQCENQIWTLYIIQESLTSVPNTTIKDSPYFIPNVITPNGDDKNEIWMIGDFLLGSEIILVDRTGKTVYQSKSYNNTFDGSNLPAGVYYYLLKNPCITENIKGHLNILY